MKNAAGFEEVRVGSVDSQTNWNSATEAQQMNILITGAGGFIGSALCSRLSMGNRVIGVFHKRIPKSSEKVVLRQADLTNTNAVEALCNKNSPEVVIHCAGIAHQKKAGGVDSATYKRVNSDATVSLAKSAAKTNPNVLFILISTVAVYGKNPLKKNDNKKPEEKSICYPSSDYALSKLDAEKRLIALTDKGIIKNLLILRLSPVYDCTWSMNLDRRVLCTNKLFYIRYGSGLQKMSALAKPNLVDFIEFLVCRFRRSSQIKADGGIKQNNRKIEIINVCDAADYEFNTIIEIFKKSGRYPSKPVIQVPLFLVWIATRLAGACFRKRKRWFYSCYDKLAYDLVFDNNRMIKTGFIPKHSLETVFPATISKRNL